MSTKTRRPVALATPPRKVISRYTQAEKESLLDNYDLEVADKTRAFHIQLGVSLQAFLLRQETELMRLPRELRGMTLSDLEDKWGGSWSGTVQRIARERMEREEGARRRAEEEAAAVAAAEEENDDVVKGKRKRGTGATIQSPERKKNARRDSAQTPSTNRSKSSKARKPRSKASQTPSKGPSTLPQNHIFNPILPPITPGYARQARMNEITFSANGSPIVLPPNKGQGTATNTNTSKSKSKGIGIGAVSPISPSRPLPPLPALSDSDSDSELDLPDPAELEAKLLARQSTSTASQPSRKPKRAPSIIFRHAPLAPIPAPAPTPSASTEPISTIPLSDGRTIAFNPLQMDPKVIDEELEQGGLSGEEKELVRKKVREEVVHRLAGMMELWKVA
ncbi:hypothetical protein BCR39DRAFT_90112 [Naematelia encephala]|uniref:Borealin N-terminal domain-containing protein n=1 Tax=Naematelia encephala TaxID=71784 RepID=A0A1Y2B9J5_9TREE|nr:hypothetical protein BCR39DRAFT_90112 [Naematelia encephala]